jgi:serine/threonine protein kinase
LERFGPFQLIRKIGSGGMGDVFLVRTPWPDRPVAALKRSRVIDDPALEARFRHELKLSVRLEHPNLIPAYDAGMIGNQLYVCSELILGKDLGRISSVLMQQGTPGPLAVAVSMMIDALAALQYIHNAQEVDGTPLKLVHRDIKPGNLILGYDGSVRIADFGVAKSTLSANLELTRPGEIVGTPSAVAPDTLRNLEATPAADTYALGTSIYRFVAGAHPHKGRTPKDVMISVMFSNARPLSDFRPDLPQWFVDLIHRMIANDEHARPTDGQALFDLRARLSDKGDKNAMAGSRQAVGKWLASLFKEDYEESLAERDRVAKMEPLDSETARDRTQIIASRGSNSSLQSRDGALKTAIDIPATEVRVELKSAAAPGEDRTQIARSGAAKPDITTQTPSRSRLPSDLQATSVIEEEDSISTAAVRALELDDIERTPPKGLIDAVDHPKAKDASSNESHRTLLRADQAPTVSAGRPRQASSPEQTMAADTLSPKPVDPAGTQPGSLTIGNAEPRSVGAQVIVSDRTLDENERRRRRLRFGAIAVAALLGAGMGVVIQSRHEHREVAIAPELNEPLRREVDRVRREMRQRAANGEAIPAEAWVLLDDVWSAMRNGDARTVRERLARIDAILDSSRRKE